MRLEDAKLILIMSSALLASSKALKELNADIDIIELVDRALERGHNAMTECDWETSRLAAKELLCERLPEDLVERLLVKDKPQPR